MGLRAVELSWGGGDLWPSVVALSRASKTAFLFPASAGWKVRSVLRVGGLPGLEGDGPPAPSLSPRTWERPMVGKVLTSGWSFWRSAASRRGLCQAEVVLQGQAGVEVWVGGGSSRCSASPRSDTPLLCLAGYYAVELVNDSLYDWNVKLLK